MRLIFIYPIFLAVDNQPNIKAVAKNYGVFPPLSLAYVAGIADSLNKYEIQFIDGNALNLSKQDILKKVRKFKPDMIFFTITTYLFHETLSWIEYIKKNYHAKIIVGGVHLSLYPKETMSYKLIDYAIIGEADDTLPEFLDAIASKSDLNQVKGIAFREKGKIVITPIREKRNDINGLPYPSRKYLPNHIYNSFISQKKNFTGIITSRGCPYRCIFCEQRTGNFRARTAEDIMKEIKECYDEYGVREFDIFDSSFTVIKQRVIDFCNLVTNSGLKFDWSVRTRVDLIDEELLKCMSKANCKRIYYGIESGNPKVLENLRKETNLEKIRNIVKLTKKYDIDTFGYFMIGNPGDTIDTIKDTINFAKSLKLDYAQFSKLSTLPGTELYELWMKKFGYDYWKGYILNKNKKIIMPRYDCDLTEEEIEYWTKKAYSSFYYRPSYILKVLFRMKSFDEFKRTAIAAMDMFFS